VEEPISIGRADHAIDERALDRDSLGAQRHISNDRLGDHVRLEMNAAGVDVPLADVEILGDDLHAYVIVVRRLRDLRFDRAARRGRRHVLPTVISIVIEEPVSMFASVFHKRPSRSRGFLYPAKLHLVRRRDLIGVITWRRRALRSPVRPRDRSHSRERERSSSGVLIPTDSTPVRLPARTNVIFRGSRRIECAQEASLLPA
jgi:hypothetical protein